jgi:hypothetical protein
MTVLERTLVWGIGCAVLCTGGRALYATSADNPYQPIVVRNVFSLKPKPEEKPAEPPKPPAPKITLNGITDLFGKQALLTVQMPAKPGEAAKAQSFILKEGERDGDLEVIQIDMTAGSVKVNNFGNEMTLTMEKDGAKPSGGAAPGAAPMPIAYTPPPNPYAPAAAPTPGNGLATLPTRILRTTPASGMGSASPYSAGVGAAGGATLPGFSFGTPQGNGSVLVPPGADMSLEEKEALTELNYQAAKDSGHATAPLFPPSRIDPTRNLAPQPDANTALEAPVPAKSITTVIGKH